MWLTMAALLGWFSYFKGWIFSDFKNISPQELHSLLSSPHKVLLIDVRSSKEFKKDHLQNAINIPLEKLLDATIRSSEIVVYSERGELSVEAARILSHRGYQSIRNLEGGVVFWIRAGYDVGAG